MSLQLPFGDSDAFDRLHREAEYYRRRADELGGEILRFDYTVSGLRHELRKKRQAFAVLSSLQESVTANSELPAMFEQAIRAINASLGMDRTIVWAPTGVEGHYRPMQWLGFPGDADERFSSLVVPFPSDIARPAGSLVVNKATPPTPTIDSLRAVLGLPYFVCIPVAGEQGLLGLLMSGRLKEAKPLYPPFDQGDVDTLHAIVRLISSYGGTLRLRVMEETDRLKNTFFANLSHELRTPITLTLGPLEQVIAGRYGAVPEIVDRQLRVMLRSQERLLGLVNQILELARLEAGATRLQAARVPDMNQFVHDHALGFKPTADNLGLELRLVLDPRVAAAEVFVDREQFSHVLINLLSNAFKFTKRGTVQVGTAIFGDVFRLTVSDTGIGIRQDQLAHVFDRFRQADGTEIREYAGTGIGLALVKEIVGMHGGEVLARSEHGRGSSFEVSIPTGRAHLDPAVVVGEEERSFSLSDSFYRLGARATAPAPSPTGGEREPPLDPARPTILYAEDSTDLRAHVRDVLAAEYNVVLAVDGQDGLEQARRHLPDLVLADQMMPRMSGRDLLRAIRDDPNLQSTPVIFLTARAGTDARIESLDAGADDYLTKPFHAAELLARIRNLLRARAQEAELARLNDKLFELNRGLEQRVQEQVGQLDRLGRLKRFFSPQLAELIVAGGTDDPLRTHRRDVTVVFVDLRGFTAFAEAAAPEEVMGVLREFHEEMGRLILGHEGTLERFTGDGMMVFFNDPVPIPDPTARAIRMAVAMRDRVAELHTRWRRLGYELDMGIGIAQGYATIGAIGFEGRWDYGAIGAVTNLASRLCAEARPGQILVSQRVLAAAQSLVKVEDVGQLVLKGFGRPVPAYNVCALTGP